MNATGPLITMLPVRVFLGHRLVRGPTIGSVVSLAGVGVILTDGSYRNPLALRLNPRDLIVLGALVLGEWPGPPQLARGVLVVSGRLYAVYAASLPAPPDRALPNAPDR